MVKYVSYWDESNWDSCVEIMNIQNHQSQYKISVYDRGGSRYWHDVRSLTAHETERIEIRDHIPGGGDREGLVIVEPGDDKSEKDEFPSMLTICDEGRNFKEGNRFVNFIRVP